MGRSIDVWQFRLLGLIPPPPFYDLCLSCQEFIGCQLNDKSRFRRARIAFLLGGMCCSIRFTSLAAYIPMGIVLALQESGPVLAFCGYILSVCAIPGLCGLLVTLLVDRYIYGFHVVPLLGNIHFNVILGM